MFYNDHPPPHFHIEYGDFKAKIAIGNREIIRGRLPSRVLARVSDWAVLHETELLDAWRRTMNHVPPRKIDA